MRFIIFVLVGSYRLSVLCDVLAGTHRPIGNSELILVVKAPSHQQICWDVLSFSVNPDPFSEVPEGRSYSVGESPRDRTIASKEDAYARCGKIPVLPQL
jgi:hypothetical protein